MKILIIEDEEALLDIYVLRLTQEGFIVSAARRGGEGVRLAKKEQPDLILLDIVMPEMDGYEVLEKLQQDPKTKNLRVIFLTNLGQEEEIRAGKHMGAEDYIIKSSLTPSALAHVVAEKLGVERKSGQLTTGKFALRQSKPRSGVACAGTRILIIEDNPVIIDMYKLRLEQEGAIVTVAGNGAWGLNQAQSGQYDVILMDMVMPAMNGLEAIKSLKADPKTAHIPILVFSNSAQDDDIEEARAAGAAYYFIKSDITPAGIVQEVKKFCRAK